MNDKTGEFFSDMSDFRQSLERIVKNADIVGRYTPQKWVNENFGDHNSGKFEFHHRNLKVTGARFARQNNSMDCARLMHCYYFAFGNKPTLVLGWIVHLRCTSIFTPLAETSQR
jgi:hypothetical protein